MPVPRDAVVAQSQDDEDFELMEAKDAADSLAKSQRPKHEDNRGQHPAGGGTRR